MRAREEFFGWGTNPFPLRHAVNLASPEKRSEKVRYLGLLYRVLKVPDPEFGRSAAGKEIRIQTSDIRNQNRNQKTNARHCGKTHEISVRVPMIPCVKIKEV